MEGLLLFEWKDLFYSPIQMRKNTANAQFFQGHVENGLWMVLEEESKISEKMGSCCSRL